MSFWLDGHQWRCGRIPNKVGRDSLHLSNGHGGAELCCVQVTVELGSGGMAWMMMGWLDDTSLDRQTDAELAELLLF